MDNAQYSGFGMPSGQFGEAYLPPCGHANVQMAGSGNVYGYGVLTVNGAFQCTQDLAGRQVCDSPTVTAQINGESITVTPGYNAPASSIANELAAAINADSKINTIVNAVTSNNYIVLSTPAQPIGESAAYTLTYPWSTSCTYTTRYFHHCSYTVVTTPISTLKLQQR